MRRRSLPLALVALLLLPAISAQAAAPASPETARADPTDRYIVVLKKTAVLKAVRDRHARQDGVRADRSFSKVLKGFAGHLSAEQVQALRADPDVAAIVPDEVVEVAGQLTPTGVLRIGGRSSRAALIDGIDQRVNADVAIVDTGIDRTHPDLNVVGGVNCSTADRTAWQDDNHHGTHVAGTVGAIDNGYGVVGVAPGVRLWAVRILDATGYGLLSWYVCGLDWIASQRDPSNPSRPLIEAVNMSVTKWGTNDNNCGYTNDDLLHQAICRVTAAGIPVIAAAANDAANASKRVPASYPEVITVSALADTDGKPGGLGGNRCYSWGGYDVDDTFADFSNYGAVVDLIAPGKCIWSTLPGNSYGYSSGTSMAAPAVTGAVALYRATRPWTTPAEAKAALQYLGSLNWNTATDPDSAHERLLNVTRLGNAGDYSISIGGADPFGETGGSVTLPVTLQRSASHFERVFLSLSAPSALNITLANASLMGFTSNTTNVTVVVPPSTPAGHYPVTITGVEGPHVHAATATIVVENDPPTMYVPVTSLIPGLTTGASTTQLMLRWPAATDPSSRIASYQLQTSIAGGGWGATLSIPSTIRNVRVTVSYGRAYQYRMRARDAAGNWSDWQVSAPVTVARVDDGSTAIRYSASWGRYYNSTAMGGSYHYTDRYGASATFTTTGRQVGLVARVGPSGGYAAVYVNGVYLGRISMFSTTAAYRRIVWVRDFGSSATRTITIKALGTSGHPRVYVDAVLIGH